MNKRTDLRPYITKGLIKEMTLTTVKDITNFVTPISEPEVPFVAAALKYVADALLENVGDDTKFAEWNAYQLMKTTLKAEKAMAEREKQ